MRGVPGQVSNLWAALHRVVCQGGLRNGLISKEGLGLGKGAGSQKVDSGHKRLADFSDRESSAKNCSRHLVHGISAATHEKAEQFTVISGRNLAEFRQVQALRVAVTFRVCTSYFLPLFCPLPCPSTHLLPNDQQTSQHFSAAHCPLHYLFSNNENVLWPSSNKLLFFKFI